VERHAPDMLHSTEFFLLAVNILLPVYCIFHSTARR